MSLPKEIAALFANSHGEFPASIGKPSNDDVQRLCRRNFAALQDIDLGDSTNTGLILYKDDHNAMNAKELFNRSDGEIEAYNPSTWNNDKNDVCLRQDKTWSRKLDLQAAIRTAKFMGKKFFLSRVEETWLVLIKN